MNSLTKCYQDPVPNIKLFTTNFTNKYSLSKIDLISAYHQIKVNPDDVTTSFELLEYAFLINISTLY